MMFPVSSPFDPHFFPVDDQLIRWGRSLDEAEQQLGPREWLPPYGGWPNLRGRCRSVLGLPAVECNLRGPARYKPIMQVSYELAPPPDHAGSGPADPAYWVTPLTQLLGPPTQAGPTPAELGGGWGSVVYTARWEPPALHIGLSVYGGVRQLATSTGPTSAGLYLDWRDELTAARPFYEAARAESAALAARFGELTEPAQLFDTQQAQSYQNGGPAGDSAAETLRRQSERALYQEGLCETPPALQSRLNDQQVALWPVPGRAAWAISTRYDTVVLPLADAPAVELTIIHPARGGGYVGLAAGDLRLQDRYGAPALERLAAALARVGLPVSRAEDYDS